MDSTDRARDAADSALVAAPAAAPTDDHVDVPLCALTRRGFFAASAGALLVACGPKPWNTQTVDAPTSNVLTLKLTDYPPLATPGGMVALRVGGQRKPLIVMRLEHGVFSVLSSACTHMGCVVRWDDEAQVLRCPCHGSRFGDDGRVIKGPAARPLQRYASQLLGGELQIAVPKG